MRIRQTVLFILALFTAVDAQEIGWTANGRDVQGTRYLPASEIARDNVGRLEVAWTYRTGEADPRFATRKPTAFEATPLVVDGTMFVGTPLGRVIALDPATGRERWVFDPKIARDVTYGDFASRGVVDLAGRVGARRRGVPPPDLRRHRAVAALRARRARRQRSARGFGRGRLRGSQGGPAHSAVRAAGLFDDVAAGRRQRRGRHRLVDRRQQPARHGQRRGARASTRGPAR